MGHRGDMEHPGDMGLSGDAGHWDCGECCRMGHPGDKGCPGDMGHPRVPPGQGDRPLPSPQELGLEPDVFFCRQLLEATGVLLAPGSEFGQPEGTHHVGYWGAPGWGWVRSGARGVGGAWG